MGQTVSAPSPSTPNSPPTLAGGSWGMTCRCQPVRWGLKSGLLRGCPHCCHFGGQPGCDTAGSAPCLCHMNVFSGPQARLAPSEKRHSPSSRSWRTPPPLSRPSPCLCEGDAEGWLGLNCGGGAIVGIFPDLQPAVREADHSPALDAASDQMGGERAAPLLDVSMWALM